MNNQILDIVFILDRSGSMQGLEDDTIGGYNSLIEKQKKEKGEARLTTILFDDEYEVIHEGKPISEVKPINSNVYFTRGTTALYDAIGKTIKNISQKQNQNHSKVLCVITTDGYENASIEYTKHHIKDLISLKKEMGWEFLFLGANIDSTTYAKDFGLEKDRIVNYHADKKGTKLIYNELSETVSEMRNHKRLRRDWKGEINKDYITRQ